MSALGGPLPSLLFGYLAWMSLWADEGRSAELHLCVVSVGSAAKGEVFMENSTWLQADVTL